MGATIVFLLIAAPQTTTGTAIFADQLELPVSLVNFGLCAFVGASIFQEFLRGSAVRQKQTGSDPLTSLIGLVLSKRRKYGGYIIHLGVAMMFVGFAGKAYEQMVDRTIEKPGTSEESKFEFGGYTFVYENIFHTSDDHKDAVTAKVGIFDGTERIATVYPAKWDYHKGEEQMTSEVAIKVRPTEDIYVVLTGFDLETKLANFRVYINPLILWVWLGFLMLAFGTLVCLIPQFVVDKLQWKPKTKLGRAADVGILLAVVVGVVIGLASQAQAASPPAGGAGEHVPAGMGMGQSGAGWAAMHRPDTPTAAKAMNELICPCGCARQDIHDCDCPTAAKLRDKVMGILASHDLNTPEGRDQGYAAVLDVFVKEYGEKVLATPKSRFPWLLPTLAAVGGLGLLVIGGRRWVNRRSGNASAPAAEKQTEADEAAADKLDDELAETDE
jgi:cytochrome c-type biogenesis protein CcmF